MIVLWTWLYGLPVSIVLWTAMLAPKRIPHRSKDEHNRYITSSWDSGDIGLAAVGLSIIWPVSILIAIGNTIGNRQLERAELRAAEEAEHAKLLEDAGL